MKPVVRVGLSRAAFSIIDDEEKKHSLSVCHVEKPDTVDSTHLPVPNGLYDARMGPIDQKTNCVTCHLNYAMCPGHPGHIELDVPVYYPFFFGDLVKLLKSKCVYCHKLRLTARKVRLAFIRLKLLEMGQIEGSDQLVDFTVKENKEDDDDIDGFNIEDKLKRIEEEYESFLSRGGSVNHDPIVQSKQRELIDSFQRSVSATKRCENCNAVARQFRKDGANKIFQKPLSKKNKQLMTALKKRETSAMSDLKKNKNTEEDWGNSDEDLEQFEAEEDNSAEEDSDNEENGDKRNSSDKKKNTEADKYVPPVEVEAQMMKLWENDGEILNFIWSRALLGNNKRVNNTKNDTWKLFFMRVVLVTANRFRPISLVGDVSAEHPQNYYLQKIIEANSKIRLLENTAITTNSSSSTDDEESVAIVVKRNEKVSKLVSAWIELQNAVNCYMDSSKDPNPLKNDVPVGIKQVLERKEGLFRRHMMGKRVNYCCRSVISPDPYLGTNEIGIPVKFAMSLHYPTPVTDWNVKYLRQLVERGPTEYPGANQIETPDGKIIRLEKLSQMERAGKAKLLLSTPGTKVYRHLVDGDYLLVNRQPTLHKPGIMAHRARILKHVKEQTLRMNYANCNTYNADFDGDEMNCHFVQSELARAEAATICNTDNQYIVPTSGNPLRGLIQDHVASAVKMTCKNTFLTKEEFQQLLFIAVFGLPGTEILSPSDQVHMPPPTIWRPKPMWTGKQVITALLSHLCRPPLPPLQLDAKTKTPATAFGAEENEHEVLIRHGELLQGVLDKSAIGAVSLGLVHAVYELYGQDMAGKLLTAFGRLFTYYLQDSGHSCGIEDLVLTAAADAEREDLLGKVNLQAAEGLRKFLEHNVTNESTSTTASTSNMSLRMKSLLAHFLAADRKESKGKLDGEMQSVINQSASAVIKACLPNGLRTSFLHNNFSMMVLTGAKGSTVNQSQISCFLGQQALEGMRVPIMISGKSLPSFAPFDGSVRAGGFVRDRFLTGVKPQEYYFHCMAGREGLVDTAVKTSRSGYLQRCLVKHLEELQIAYDMTVRDSGGNVVQFLYGEDGLDPLNAGMLGGKQAQMLFLARNSKAFSHKYSLSENFFLQGFEMDTATKQHNIMRQIQLSQKQLPTIDLFNSLQVGMYVMSRMKLNIDDDWDRSNITTQFYPAQVIKVRQSEKKGHIKVTIDLKFIDHDNLVIKKIPQFIKLGSDHSTTRRSLNVNGTNKDIIQIRLVQVTLPSDTAQSKLKLGNAVGACSEKFQSSIEGYIQKNPDRAVMTERTNERMEGQLVEGSGLELLSWIKYMRSLAAPGEAVGCVAAQSVGEPSTQMTLNTFHLAGHGGANVTLGIPRLREIIMTASKTLKTPTMFVPLHAIHPMDSAKTLARQLSRLPLVTLLDHCGGVEVGEEIYRQDYTSKWERKYRIRLCFEDRRKIAETFGVSFEDIVQTLKTSFISKLDTLIKLEQRRAGESTAGLNDPLGKFRSSMTGGEGEEGMARGGFFKKVGGNANNNDDDNNDNEERGTGGTGGSSKKKAAAEYDSDEEDDEEETSVENDEDIGNLKLQGSGRELTGYDDDDEEVVEEDDENSQIGSDNDERDINATTDHEDDNDSKENNNNVLQTPQIKNKRVSFGANMIKTITPIQQQPSTPVINNSTPFTPGKANKKLTKREAAMQQFAESFTCNEEENWVQFHMYFPVRSRRLLMAQIAEKATQSTMVRATKDILNSYAVEDPSDSKRSAVIVEGVNFEAIWNLSDKLIEHNNIQSNDIWQMLMTYGVEAARQSIVSEIQRVFGVYGIDVNPRHLSLIADFMTRKGEFTAMNRMGMLQCPSPLLQMSFETTCAFLTKACQEGVRDNLQSPSSRIVMGSVPKVGTGCFDLMVPLNVK